MVNYTLYGKFRTYLTRKVNV